MRKNYTIFNFLSLGFVLFSIFLLVYIFQEDTSTALTFEDEGLELAVREAIDKEEGDILLKDVELLQTLDAKGYDIKSLEGIESLLELRELDLEDNFIESVKPLKNLTKLEKLNLRNNEITSLEDIDFQEILFLNIRHLSLRHNVKRDEDGKGTRLSDITMLGEMVSLRKLKLRDNHIEDLSPLSNLRRLTELDIRENKFKTIEPLEVLTRLEKLNLRENKIKSLEPIQYLSRLTYLNIHSNEKIESLEPIGNLVNLETLIMRNVSLKDDSDFLQKLTKLQRFNAIDSDIETVSPTIFTELRKKGALQGEVRPIRKLHTLEAPQLSQDSGFYKDEFELAIENPVRDQNVYYTLDGSEPTLDSDVYTDPIQINDLGDNEATVIRAKVLSEDNLMSETVTKTYFVNDKIDERFTLPIFSLVTDPDNLFDEEIGIYHENNFDNRGSDWERPVHIDYFETNKKMVISQDAGLRIHGGATRKNAQKSLRIYAKDEYSEKKSFKHDFFESLEKRNGKGQVDDFKRLNLRAAGDGWYRTMFDDAFMQALVAPLNSFDTQAYRASVIFINGEYYGIQNIRERYDRFYYQSHYDIDPEDLVVLKINAQLSEGKNKDVFQYNNMLKKINERPLSKRENYKWLNTMIDTDNFRDYFISEIYFGNDDWPHNNIRFWRKTIDDYDKNAQYGHDGRWRWSMYDTDAGFYFNDNTIGFKEYERNYKHNTIDWVMGELDGRTGENTWPNFLFRSIMENEEFYYSFLNRMNDLINSTFLETEVNDLLDKFEEGIHDEMPHHIERWGAIESMDSWHDLINNKRIFAKERPSYIRKYMMVEFNISNIINIDIKNETEEGYIRLNTIDINNDLPGNTGSSTWSGTYFTEIPITLEAIPKDGYKFSHWEGIDDTEEKIEIVPTGDLSVQAVFTKEN